MGHGFWVSLWPSSKITADGDCSHEMKTLAPCKKSCDQPRQHIKKQRHYFVNKGPSSQSYGFSSSHVRIWELDYKESWAPKNWCFWTVVLEKTLESLLDCKEIQPVHPKGDQSWLFIGRIDAEAETPTLWPSNAKIWLIGKHPDAGKDWRQEEKGMTEDEMVGWHHQLNGHEFEQSLGVGDGQWSLVCCSPWGCKELGTTEWLNCGSAGKESACNVADLGWSLGWEDPLEYRDATHSSILAWRIPWVHGVARSWTRLSNFHFHIAPLWKGGRKRTFICIYLSTPKISLTVITKHQKALTDP